MAPMLSPFSAILLLRFVMVVSSQKTFTVPRRSPVCYSEVQNVKVLRRCSLPGFQEIDIYVAAFKFLNSNSVRP